MDYLANLARIRLYPIVLLEFHAVPQRPLEPADTKIIMGLRKANPGRPL
jgi:hypothetical protein